MIIEQPAVWLRWLYPKALWRLDKNEKTVYLTFDDGPIPEATPFILDTLKGYGIKATFFMVGQNAEKHPELLERATQEGHAIGNHTYNHISSGKHGLRTYSLNVEKADSLLHSHLFRPPHGWMRIPQYLRLKSKYKIVMWDVVTRDYSKWTSDQDVVNIVKKYTRNGSIITFHDSIKSIAKLKTALPTSIQWLIQQGYKFKTIQ